MADEPTGNLDSHNADAILELFGQLAADGKTVLRLSLLVGAFLGGAIFGAPLPLVVSPVALPAWLAVTLLGSAAASAGPAWAVSRLTIRETLAYA